MVNSKKMSKSSIAVIVLSILLVLSMILGLTGAWFTDKDSATQDSVGVTFGKFGNIEVTVDPTKWQEHPNGGALADVGDSRDFLMPGDLLETGTVTLTYTKGDEGQNESAFYLVKIGAEYYTVNNATKVFEKAISAAGTIADGTSLTVTGKVASIEVDGTKYNLDGKIDGSASSSGSIPNGAQTKTVSFEGVTAGADGSEVVYEVCVIQVSNMSPESAYTYLKTNWASVAAQAA